LGNWHTLVVATRALGDEATVGELPLLLEEANDDDCQLKALTALGENMVAAAVS
jgi:hypothetical protein